MSSNNNNQTMSTNSSCTTSSPSDNASTKRTVKVASIDCKSTCPKPEVSSGATVRPRDGAGDPPHPDAVMRTLRAMSQITDRNNLILEVQQRAATDTALKWIPAPAVRVPCSLRSALVSPLLCRMLIDWAGGDAAAASSTAAGSVSECASSCPGYRVTLAGSSQPSVVKLDRGQLSIELSHPAIHADTINTIIQYLDYHVHDELFESTTRFDDFEDDPFEREHARLHELPCFYDWSLISTFGGGDKMAPEKRAAFYDLMIAASTLQLAALIELGGKYIGRAIAGQSVEYVRALLGIVPDLDPETEKRIRQENDRILNR